MSRQARQQSLPAHPTVLTPVQVRVPQPADTAVELVSRVLDLESADGATPTQGTAEGEAPTIVVARPDLTGVVDAGVLPRPEQELTLGWPHENGQVLLPVTAVADRRRYGPVWLLTPVGEPRRVQRREFFRVPFAAPVTLTPIDDDGGSGPARSGTVVDLGEGGLLAVVEGERPAPGTEVEVRLLVGGDLVRSVAEVVRHVELPGGGPGVALRFSDPEEHGDLIRSVAFAEQRRLAARHD
ncbi:flagellar brake protein [Nocardioides ferulae]|uniref:flagellar brake protein n=1 Tax=Nocardioides ferulae TaxID=2340821 RepID=UPI000EAEBE69|nr:PilZ domain-containing protein [Nocardioides ferulae]